MPLRRRYPETAESSKKKLRNWGETSRWLTISVILLLVCSALSNLLILVILALMLWSMFSTLHQRLCHSSVWLLRYGLTASNEHHTNSDIWIGQFDALSYVPDHPNPPSR